MQGIRWNISLALVIIFCNTILCLPSIRTKREEDSLALDSEIQSADLNPIESEENDAIAQESAPKGIFAAASSSSSGKGGKSFSGSNFLGNSQQISTTTDDTPDFDRTNVMVEIPDQLFSNSFTTVTRLSQLLGDFMLNSARRYANFVRLFKPLLGKSLIIKGYNPPPRTTTTTVAPLDD